jgi:hypothetical protein
MENLPELHIPEQLVEATVKDGLSQVVEAVYNQMRSLISVSDIRAKGLELLNSEDLRKEMSVRQAFLTMDLYQIQMSNWVDILQETKDFLDEILALRKVEIKAEAKKLQLLREVQLAEVAVHKAKAEEDWDIALLRFRKIKGHLFLGAVLLVAGVFIGQAIEGAKHPNASSVRSIHKPNHK